MIAKKNYRHEFKYIIDYSTYLALKAKLKVIMQSDNHCNQDGYYTIRSIYFDNYKDKALREKIDGDGKREKFRIRYYNDDFSFITLEKKIKNNTLCLKSSSNITESEVRSILNGTYELTGEENSLIQELYAKMNYQLLRPRVLVSYKREPFIYEAGNVRITFDSDIRTTLFHKEFLEKEVEDINTQDDPNSIVLEVKYDAYLPEIISDLLQSLNIRQVAFSKYGACRRFG